MNITITKDYNGLCASTEIPLTWKSEEGAPTLCITTMKRHNGMVSTHASVVYYKPDGSYTTVIFQDYSKTIAQVKIARVTEKTLKEAHTKALEQLSDVMRSVESHYNIAA